ncbi:MAG TPA: hypothetical protein VGB73_20185 [Pyrinomonadaceae bacterium]
MKTGIIKTSLTLALLCGTATAQQTPTQQTTGTPTQDAPAATQTTDAAPRPSEQRVNIDAEAVALDADGRPALVARLRTTRLTGTIDAPERNSRFLIENRSPFFYNYASGWATFYDAQGVRCGEGLWKLEALAPTESAEVDTPGLRLTCTPATWRIVATNLLTRTTDVAKPSADAPPQPQSPETTSTPANSSTTLPPLEININGKTLPIQPGNPLEIKVGKERVRITLNRAP